MRTSLLLLSVVLAVSPAHAAAKVKKFKKLVLCAVNGEQTATLGFEEKGAPKVKIADALDASAEALEAELSEAGVGFIPSSETKAAAQARMDREEKEMGGKLDASAAAMGQGADLGANAGMNAAMAAAMNNPALTPEQREQMRKAFAGSAGQAGAGMQAKAKAQNADTLANRKGALAAGGSKDGSPATWETRSLCGHPADEIYRDANNKSAFEFLDEVGGDGWLYVNASFGDVIGSGVTAWAPTAAAAGVAKAAAKARWAPLWVYEAKLYDKAGKLVWSTRKPVKGEEVEIGKTPASALKVIKASAPDGVKKLVAELTK
ncbi:hypothetical protein EPO15_05065 [bacterium]|nr:MAG: hypothetical protein EPO15_05065 [bacterium]